LQRRFDEKSEEKNAVTQDEYGDFKGHQARAVDTMATAPSVSRATFAHINEKKLLRRIDWHLLPTLTLLYLYRPLIEATSCA
jgi:hypothetical protein